MNINSAKTPQKLNGLTESQVQENRKRYGENVLTPPQHVSLWKLYLDKYKDPIIQVLLVAAAISSVLAFIEKDFVETIGIFVAVILATSIGFFFERDAAKKFDVLTALGEEQPVKVRRDGKVREIPRKELVPGDVVLVETGDEVPADGHLLLAHNLEVDESALTGEPLAEKRPMSDTDEKANHSDNVSTAATAEQPSEHAYPLYFMLRSSMVMAGRGEFVVTAIGDETEIGKVARQSTEVTATKTPLNIQLDKLASRISKIGSAVAVSAFLIFLVHSILTDPLWHGSDYFKMAEVVLQYFMMAVTLIVMAVPEGLPMAVTLALALNMRRMLKSNNLVRRLHACETMGAVTVICTDKTGTLTQNRMQVAAVMDEPGGQKADDVLLKTAMAVNTTAELDGEQPIGNPTEGALLLWLRAQNADYKQLRSSVKVMHTEPFSTEKKYMTTTARLADTTYTFMKGAPEMVMKRCDMAPDVRRQVENTLLGYQQKAMRTLALAVQTGDDTTAPYHLQAVVAISDPIRNDVPDAVSQCRNAGIHVKVVTGDTAATAIEIARQIGIWSEEHTATEKENKPRHAISGSEWNELSDDEAYKLAPHILVMYRARPSNKQRLVNMLQKHGEVVAVTGDGTNDAPALHHAHVGLSLGSGTSVAKQASAMTLLDDSFGSIVSAVMWGRSLYKNIQRFLFFQLVVNLTALLLVLVGSVIGTEMPLTVTQILWVNLIMDTFAALALASLPPSREVMKDKPRSPKAFILTRAIEKGILWVGLAFFAVLALMLYWFEDYRMEGVDNTELTWFFTAFVFLQFWNLFNAKALGSTHSAFRHFFADKGLILVLGIILFGQWLIVTFGGAMFRTVPLSWKEWGVLFCATSVVLWVGELYRLICRKQQ